MDCNFLVTCSMARNSQSIASSRSDSFRFLKLLNIEHRILMKDQAELRWLRAVIPYRNSQCHQICAHKPKGARIHEPQLAPSYPHPHPHPHPHHPQGITLVYSRLAQQPATWRVASPAHLEATAATCLQHPISGAYVNTLCSLQLLSELQLFYTVAYFDMFVAKILEHI